MAIIDMSPLVQSRPFVLGPAEEVRVDLIVHKKPPAPKTELCGVVTSGCCEHDPVEGAVVKVLDRDYNPVAHASADGEGRYEFCHVLQPGKYKLTAAAQGYYAAQSIDFVLRNGSRRRIDLHVEEEPSARQGVLYGKTLDAQSAEPIPNAVIILADDGGKPVVETCGNEYGQYLMASISPGRYTVKARREGFFDASVTVWVQQRQLIRTDLWLRIDPGACAGTVSGIVLDRCEYGDLIRARKARVGLYRLEDQLEILEATAPTNEEGLYLFTGLRPGSYRVKAKLDGGYEYSREFQVP